MGTGPEARQFSIPGLLLFKPEVHRDARGDLTEIYQERLYRQSGVHDVFVQDNLCTSTRGVLRGLHFQLPPAAQAKLITVVHGDVFDAIVDLRPASPTYLRCESVPLSAYSGVLYVPRGCAHGFCVNSDTATLLYKLSARHRPDLECGIAWDDPDLAIEWPVQGPILSTRDAALPGLREVRRRLDQMALDW